MPTRAKLKPKIMLPKKNNLKKVPPATSSGHGSATITIKNSSSEKQPIQTQIKVINSNQKHITTPPVAKTNNQNKKSNRATTTVIAKKPGIRPTPPKKSKKGMKSTNSTKNETFKTKDLGNDSHSRVVDFHKAKKTLMTEFIFNLLLKSEGFKRQFGI